MSDKVLGAGFSLADRTRPLVDGRVTVPGYAIDLQSDDVHEIFAKALTGAYALCELSVSSHIVAETRGDSRYYGLPIFVSRAFRHGAILVREDAGIVRPADLAGRTVGLPLYQQTSLVWVRGMLRDLYGVDTRSIAWRVGGVEAPEAAPRIPKGLPDGVDVAAIGGGATLLGLASDGKLDALLLPWPPARADALDGLRPLFPNAREAEEDYYRATGFFPMMHLMAVRKDAAEADPDLPAALTRAFMEAKALATADLTTADFLRVSLPWLTEFVADIKALMGENFWRYGYAENLEELKAICRYVAEDGLVAGAPDPAALFHPGTRDIADRA